MKRCGDLVPPALAGGLGPKVCSLEVGKNGLHAGDHKAHKTIPHVGRITWKWKNRNPAPFSQPPVINLPLHTNDYLTGQVRKKPSCSCPDWWSEQGQKMHHSPCVLV